MISIYPVHLIITAAGSSTRLGTGCKKEYLSMQDEENNTVLSLACIAFLNAFLDEKISSNFQLASLVITCPKGKTEDAKKAFFSNANIFEKLNVLNISPCFIEGGETRQLSVLNALETCSTFSFPKEKTSIVLIHDGARPWVDFQTIYNVLNTTREKEACVPVTPVTDTIALQKDGTIECYVNRSLACNLQTPQGFCFTKLFEAHKKSAKENRTDCTDDTTVWKVYCGNVYTCEGSTKNTKITFASDLEKIHSKK
jgi:2-C-methyl-D-erythritol 4-phosphate cytidylyltransferase